MKPTFSGQMYELKEEIRSIFEESKEPILSAEELPLRSCSVDLVAIVSVVELVDQLGLY